MPRRFFTFPPLPLLLAALACFLLSSCLQVMQFGDYWEKGTVDTSLEGYWQFDEAGANRINIVAMNAPHHMLFIQIGELLMQGRTIEDQGQKILMLKPFHEAKEAGWGWLLPYRKHEGSIRFQRPAKKNPSAINAYFAKYFPKEKGKPAPLIAQVGGNYDALQATQITPELLQAWHQMRGAANVYETVLFDVTRLSDPVNPQALLEQFIPQDLPGEEW